MIQRFNRWMFSSWNMHPTHRSRLMERPLSIRGNHFDIMKDSRQAPAMDD